MLLRAGVCVKKLILPDNSRKQNLFSCEDIAASSVDNLVGVKTFRYVWQGVFFHKARYHVQNREK